MSYLDKLKDPRWQKKRLEILNRDEWTCTFCDAKDTTLNVHHISYFNEPWDAPNTHLITLCEDCHKAETDDLKEVIKRLPNQLKSKRFSAESIELLSSIFETDRQWFRPYPSLPILKMVVDDNVLWNFVSAEYWRRLEHDADLKRSIKGKDKNEYDWL